MTKSAPIQGAALLLLLVAASGSELRATVTPVEKVIDLLTKLSDQVAADGKKEATQYDKYACFCKEQADGKIYAIETSEKKIAALDAKIEQLTTEISVLNTDITNLGKKITSLGHQIGNATETRAEEHKEYLVQEADMSGAIDQLERAIAALKESKAALSGKVEMEALTQVKVAAGRALAVASQSSRAALTGAQIRALSSLTGAQPGVAYEYNYHSNDIIALVEGLRVTFKENKEQLDQDEFETNSLFEKKVLGLSNEKKFAEKEKAEKEALEQEKSEELGTAQADKVQETKEKDADKAFMQVLTEDCEAKADYWDQRSQTRAAELTAIGQAMETLKSGVVPNWGANRKLVGLQKGEKPTHQGHWVYLEGDAIPPAAAEVAVAAKPPMSFLQLHGGLRGGLRGSSRRAATWQEKVLQLLSGAAGRLGSPVLSAVALKVRAADDHFVKVRSIIKDLVAKLESDKLAEAEHKDFCDKAMSAAVTTRDEQQEKKESVEAQISEKEAEKAQLLSEISELSKAIAANNKALAEAQELRIAEKLDNDEVIGQSGAGKEAVEFALNLLKKFYEDAGAFVQGKAGYVPPNSDRDGSTVADLAPEVFNSDYKGRQDDSKGVIGLLEVILSDFDRTGTVVTTQEKMSAGEFEDYKKEMEKDTTAKQKQVDTKNGLVSTIKDDLVGLTDEKMTAEKAYAGAISELESLRTMCVEGEETYEERVAKRQKEIEALKEAHAILEDWKN